MKWQLFITVTGSYRFIQWHFSHWEHLWFNMHFLNSIATLEFIMLLTQRDPQCNSIILHLFLCTELVQIFYHRFELMWQFHSQTCGDGGSSEGWATCELAKFLNDMEFGLRHKGTLFFCCCSKMNLCSFSLQWCTEVSPSSKP